MPKVFITQIPNRRDEDTGSMVPTVNVGPAAEHGEIVIMMPSQASFYATGDLVDQIADHLRNYDYDAGDTLVALGDPSVIAVACGYLGRRFGRFTILKWDRIVKRYIPARVNLGGAL